MFYAKLENGNVAIYPYTITDLRLATPNVSFPPNPSDSELLAFDVVPVTPSEPPIVAYNKRAIRWAEKKGKKWVEVWTVVDIDPQEASDILNAQWNFIRTKRNEKLSESDWTQLADVPFTETQKMQWSEYRQALRDITLQEDPFNIIWP